MTQRIEKTVTVINPLGLHARAAAHGKSIMGVLTLAAGQGSEVKITCEGPDAAEAVDAIAKLFAAGFYEMKQ